MTALDVATGEDVKKLLNKVRSPGLMQELCLPTPLVPTFTSMTANNPIKKLWRALLLKCFQLSERNAEPHLTTSIYMERSCVLYPAATLIMPVKYLDQVIGRSLSQTF